MKRLIDIVNFNSDASCLTSSHWVDSLTGGRASRLYRWAELYVRHQRKVVLGFTGGTLADIRAFNPEALDLVNANPQVFGTVARPFAHDIHLLRRPASFAFNVELGRRAQQLTLPNLQPARCYLPPEFMLTGEQVVVLAEQGYTAVLINAARFVADNQRRIPTYPYLLRGVLGTKMGCVPIDGELTLKYLHAMQGYDEQLWREAVVGCRGDPALLWRDGESSFLLADGIAREEYWLARESPDIERCTLEDWPTEFARPPGDETSVVEHFPIHSFGAWMKEFRMLGFLGRLNDYEDVSMHGSAYEVALWLGLINSDVLSAVEKRPVKIALRRHPGADLWDEQVLHRSRREFEAEEYLVLLGRLRAGNDVWSLVARSQDAHMRKLHARALLLQEILEK
jgi:hypothetical protein